MATKPKTKYRSISITEDNYEELKVIAAKIADKTLTPPSINVAVSSLIRTYKQQQ